MLPEATGLRRTQSQLPFFEADKEAWERSACLTVALRGTTPRHKQQKLQQGQRRVNATGHEKVVKCARTGILPPFRMVMSDVDGQIGVPDEH